WWSGLALTAERQSELTATGNACNRANVAIYPLGVRGLLATPPGGLPGASLDEPSFPHDNVLLAFLFAPGANRKASRTLSCGNEGSSRLAPGRPPGGVASKPRTPRG